MRPGQRVSLSAAAFADYEETIRRGVLAPSLVVSYSHSDDDIDRTVEVVAQACAVYRKALDARDVRAFLVGRPVQPVFRRFA